MARLDAVKKLVLTRRQNAAEKPNLTIVLLNILANTLKKAKSIFSNTANYDGFNNTTLFRVRRTLDKRRTERGQRVNFDSLQTHCLPSF